MTTSDPAWDPEILESMKPGAVTFAWDDGEILTVPAPEGSLKDLNTAWEWVDEQIKAFKEGKGSPRSVCLRLENGAFRGLRFPEVKPGAVHDPY
jgi:hypothetical protein